MSAGPSSTYEIHFFYNDACDPSGFGGGQTPLPLGPPPVIVNVTTDATGNASFTRQTNVLPPGKFLTALTRRFATTPAGPSTLIVSEFSACRQIAALPDLIFMNGFQ